MVEEINPKRQYKHSEESKQKISEALKGRKFSEEHRKKIGQAQIGNQRGKGHKVSEEHRKILSEIQTGSNNNMWKGDDVGNCSLHLWVRSHFWPTRLCQLCMLVPSYDLANITGVYNRDFKNWRYYCRKCHMISDDRLHKLHRSRSKE